MCVPAAVCVWLLSQLLLTTYNRPAPKAFCCGMGTPDSKNVQLLLARIDTCVADLCTKLAALEKKASRGLGNANLLGECVELEDQISACRAVEASLLTLASELASEPSKTTGEETPPGKSHSPELLKLLEFASKTEGDISLGIRPWF